MTTFKIEEELDIKEYTIGEAMEIIPEEDLIFIAAYNPQSFQSMCMMWSLEIQLQKEGNYPSQKNIVLKREKPKNWLLRLYHWIRLYFK